MQFFDSPDAESPKVVFEKSFFPPTKVYSEAGYEMLANYAYVGESSRLRIIIGDENLSMSRTVAACAIHFMTEPWRFSTVNEMHSATNSLNGVAFALTSSNATAARLFRILKPMAPTAWGMRKLSSCGYYFGLEAENYPKIPSYQNNYQGLSVNNFSPLINANGEFITMPRVIYRTFQMIISAAGKVVTRKELDEMIRGTHIASNANTNDVTISRLRDYKLFDLSRPGLRIRPAKKEGYYLTYAHENTTFEDKLLSKQKLATDISVN